VLLGACSTDDSGDTAATGVEVRPFEEVQADELVFEADPLDPTRGIFRVETTEPMICAIVWGETDELGRLNNSSSMNGTGIVDHDVVLPGVEPGRSYFFVVQGTTASGTLYRSELSTFTIPRLESPDAVAPTGSSPSGENLALAATVVDVSSEFSSGFAAELAIDGDLGTEWSTSGDGDDGSITIDLGATLDIAAVEFVTRSMADGSAVTSSFTVSVDGGAELGPFPAATPRTGRVAEVGATGRVIRFDVEQSSGGNVGAAEIRVLGPHE
jgi:hypothetical protein